MEKLKNFYSGKKVLVTGHTGFKGSWLSEILTFFGSEVFGYSLPPDPDKLLYSTFGLEDRVNSSYSDIRDYPTLKDFIDLTRPEIAIHMAAQPIVRESYDSPLYTFQTNTLGTINLLEAVKNSGSVKSLVVVTTDKVYENRENKRGYSESDRLGGKDPYSASKACAELAVESYRRSFLDDKGVFVATARSGNIIGGGDWSKDRIVPDIVRAIFEGNGEIVLRNPEATRPWQHVLDSLRGYLILGRELYNRNENSRGSWNFSNSTGNPVTVRELVESFISILGRGSYRVERDFSKSETINLGLDSTKANTVLGWSPRINMGQAINKTLEWYRNYYEGRDMQNLSRSEIEEHFE